MMFTSPWRLLLLLFIAGAAISYYYLQEKREKYALRFSSAELLSSVVDESPGFRRHIPAILFLCASASMVFGFAGPNINSKIAKERATVILAIDVSLSMNADDVSPTRFVAAQEAAKEFVNELPDELNVGLISFSGVAAVEVPPTQDRQVLFAGIDRLRLAESTAIGEAIVLALKAAEDEQGKDIPVRIILLSDGETTAGIDEYDAVSQALRADVPISTIAFGTPDGYVFIEDPTQPELGATATRVPASESNLRKIAEDSNGSFFQASSLEQLELIYEDIGSSIGYEQGTRDISDWFIAFGLLLLTGAGTLSLVWFQRLP